MTRFVLVLFAAASLLATGCEPTIDASSEESVKTSIQEVKESLPEDRQKEFQEAVVTVAFSDADMGAMMAGLQDGESLIDAAKTKLDGKSADEIFAMAEEVEARRAKEKAEREAKRRAEQLEQAQRDIGELEAMRESSQQAKTQLEQFEVDNAKFYKRSQRYGRAKPVIELEVTNNTDEAISRAYFKGTYATPSRSVPWLEETFNYSISGGLEPGESASWNLAPNTYSEWGSLEERDDAVFTVAVTRLDGADGEALYEVEFDEDDAKKLEKLEEQVAELTGE